MEATLEAAGLRRYFEAIVASGVEGYAKPHPKIFEAALERLKVSPASTLYVGDNIVEDIQGATAVGMRAVLIDRDGTMPNYPNSIASLYQLLGHLSTVDC